jgi:hypothetical protein
MNQYWQEHVRHYDDNKKLDQKSLQVLTVISPNTLGCVRETTVWERLELRKLKLFNPITWEQYRLLPASIHAQLKRLKSYWRWQKQLAHSGSNRRRPKFLRLNEQANTPNGPGQPDRRQLKNETRESHKQRKPISSGGKKTLSGKEESGRELNPSLPNSQSRRLQHGKSSDNWDRRPRRPSTDETDLGSTYSTLARESKKTEAEGGGNKISKRENELGTSKHHAQAGTRFEAAACASKNRIRG